MKKHLSLLIGLFLGLIILYSCEEESTDPNATGQLIISLKTFDNTGKTEGKSQINEPSALLISICKSNGESVYTNEKFELYKFNDDYISVPISLKIGSYKLMEFLVVDSENNVIYATPKENSEKAYLVEKPLPIEYSIVEDDVKKISPEVISTENISPEEFGYSTFSFNLVETLNFLSTVFVYNDLVGNFEITDANILIKNNNDTLYSGNLEAKTNLITINSDFEDCKIIISKVGYISYSESFTKDSIIKHFSKPLTVILQKGNSIVLQPDAQNGKDAFIENYAYDNYTNRNFGVNPEFPAIAWTSGGEPLVVRSLIDFDLSTVPANAEILEATLFLYAAENTTNGPGHSQLSGSNEWIIQRVTSSWDELTVTWNTKPTTTIVNQIEVPASTSDMQDYQVDVKSLIIDMLAEPSSSFGFMIKLKTESYYRRVLFASSDYEIASKRPKLYIRYQE